MTAPEDSIDPRIAEMVGLRFVVGGRDVSAGGAGCDCAGLVLEAVRRRGVRVHDPRGADRGAERVPGTWPVIDRPGVPGDIWMPDDATHVSVYAGGGWVLTTCAETGSRLVRASSVTGGTWRRPT